MPKHKKRHWDDSRERILRRLEDIERLLSSAKRRRRSRSSLELEYNPQEGYGDYSDNEDYSPPPTPYYCMSPQGDQPRTPEGSEPKPCTPERTQSKPHTPERPQTPCDNTENTESLDKDILEIIGDAPKVQPAGKDIHGDIATRLTDIVKNGLNKEQKDKIKNDYPIPGNCEFFKAPTLNPEIKAAISDILQKKDSSIEARQNQMGVALTALATAMDILVTDKSETSQTLLKHVSSESRLVCDSHHIDSKMRRNFLISTLNNKLKDTLKDSERDKTLFGQDLSEKLRATKAITRTSQELRPYNKPKPNVPKNSSAPNNLNWKHPQPSERNLNRKIPMVQQRPAGHQSSAPRDRAEIRPHQTSQRAHYKSARYRHP